MNRDRAVLLRMIQSIEEIRDYTINGEEAFLREPKTQDAVILKLIVIAESAARLSPDVKSSRPDIEWRSMAGMRNKLVHDYFGIELSVIWRTVEAVLPKLHTQLLSLLNEIGDISG